MLVTCGALSGVFALVASFRFAAFGGISTQAATLFFGAIFLFSLAKAFRHIRRREIDLHREWMIRVFALAMGVATIRVFIGLFQAIGGLGIEEVFGTTFWLGFGVNLVVAEVWINVTRRTVTGPAPRRGAATSRKAGHADRATRPARARTCAPRGRGVGRWGPTSGRVGFGAQPRLGNERNVGQMRQHTRATLALLAATLMLAWLSAAPVDAQQGATDGEWRTYAADVYSSKYSPLDQIRADNFGDLEVAWRWRTADTHLVYEDEQGASLVSAQTLFDLLEAKEPGRWVTRPRIGRLVATPLMVDGVLYLSTPLYQAAAIDARTGETLWIHDPKIYEAGTPAPAPWTHRGVAYWENGGTARIVWGTGDGYLVAVDAKTGLPAAEFGDNGRVDLTENLPRATRGQRDKPQSAAALLPVGAAGRRRHDHRRLLD